jgi:hypothetical protein
MLVRMITTTATGSVEGLREAVEAGVTRSVGGRAADGLRLDTKSPTGRGESG